MNVTTWLRPCLLLASMFAAWAGSACGDDPATDHDTTPPSDTTSEVGEVGPAECDDPSDCAALVGAPGACQLVACVSGQCALRPATDGATCDDGDPCTTGDACAQSACVGAAAECDDANACTRDACAPGAGCVHVAIGGACDDGDACTTGDRCAAEVCAGLERRPGCASILHAAIRA